MQSASVWSGPRFCRPRRPLSRRQRPNRLSRKTGTLLHGVQRSDNINKRVLSLKHVLRFILVKLKGIYPLNSKSTYSYKT